MACRWASTPIVTPSSGAARAAPAYPEQFSGRRSRTQLGRALEVAAIAWIGARSPQAKGRVERLWGTAQDRLLSELRLAGASTIDEANAVLADYLPRHDRRFAVPPASAESAWRPLPAGRPPETVFCFRHPRSVARDGTFTLKGRDLMIPGRTMGGWKGRVLEIQERLDGSLWVELEGEFRRASPAPERPVVLRASGPRKRYVPPPDHPWRRYPASRPPVPKSLTD